MKLRWIAASALLLSHIAGLHLGAQSAAALPATLERYLAAIVSLSAADRRQLLSGSAVTRLLDGQVVSEVAVFGAVWINGSPQQYLQSVNDIETFERGGSFRVTRKISSPPQRADFRDLRLPEEAQDLQDCRVGDCRIKMDREWIERIRRDVDFSKPTAKASVDATFRELAYEYVTRYRRDGNAALASYADKPRVTSVAGEFQAMTSTMPLLSGVPLLRHYLLDYPRASLPGSTEFLYWQDVKFGLKPTIRINHLVIYEHGKDTILASKMLYATHYFWTALELRLLVPEPARGPGFWFCTISRSRTDGLTGLVGRLVRLRVRREAQQGTLNILLSTKAKLERPSRG